MFDLEESLRSQLAVNVPTKLLVRVRLHARQRKVSVGRIVAELLRTLPAVEVTDTDSAA